MSRLASWWARKKEESRVAHEMRVADRMRAVEKRQESEIKAAVIYDLLHRGFLKRTYTYRDTGHLQDSFGGSLDMVVPFKFGDFSVYLDSVSIGWQTKKPMLSFSVFQGGSGEALYCGSGYNCHVLRFCQVFGTKLGLSKVGTFCGE